MQFTSISRIVAMALIIASQLTVATPSPNELECKQYPTTLLVRCDSPSFLAADGLEAADDFF